MEPDRYKQSHFSYIAGMFCLIASIGLFAFSLFLFPYFIFEWHYDIPSFMIDLTTMLETEYGMPSPSVKWLLFSVLDIPAVVLFIIADILSNKIDDQIYEDNRFVSTSRSRKAVANSGLGESSGLFVRMVMIVIVVFIIAGFFQWAIS